MNIFYKKQLPRNKFEYIMYKTKTVWYIINGLYYFKVGNFILLADYKFGNVVYKFEYIEHVTKKFVEPFSFYLDGDVHTNSLSDFAYRASWDLE